MTNQMPGALRVGAVRYLNSKPLIENLAELAPECELKLDYPSRLADHLAQGTLDVALIPSVEYFSHPNYEIISDACVASCGPVLSVKMYSRVPVADIRTLSLDEGSRTSAALLRVMLAERFGVLPKLQSLCLDQTIQSTKTDAILLIGDRAIHPPKELFCETWDLGEEWLKWTGLPFVFAMWVARKGADLQKIETTLQKSRDLGEAAIPDIAAREATELKISVEVAQNYLKNNLHFRLQSAEKSGLRLFSELAKQLEIIPHDHSIKFRN